MAKNYQERNAPLSQGSPVLNPAFRSLRITHKNRKKLFKFCEPTRFGARPEYRTHV
jgi:hypothetical protein